MLAGRKATGPQPAYHYYWSYVPAGPGGTYPQGAHHAIDQPFVFHVLNETDAQVVEDGGGM